MKQISHKLIMRNINELIGIINGMLKKRLNDAQIETKIGYLKNCVKERKNLGIDLIDLLDNADAIDIIHSRAESQLGSTLNSYSGTYVRDPEIVFVSLVLIGMLYYDGAFYESVRKTYKSLYQRYSEQKVEGLIRTLLNNYRTKDDATGTKTRIINVVLAGSIVPSYYLGSFFEFIPSSVIFSWFIYYHLYQLPMHQAL